MKIVILAVGKTDMDYVEIANKLYLDRLKHYAPTSLETIPEQKPWKKMSPDDRKRAEGKAILERLNAGDAVLLLDEKGKGYTSEAFAKLLEKNMASGIKRLVFVIGGAFGFSDEVYAQVPQKLKLSDMTFSHQMVRSFLLEQIYRGMTILKNEPYHNR
jgi:23S rRNA (pseudouridine1915-N3)-methyltransferase